MNARVGSSASVPRYWMSRSWWWPKGSIRVTVWSPLSLMSRLLMRTIGLLTLVLLGFGCVSPHVNPSTPKPGTGYVDLYSASSDLWWDVQRFDTRANKFQKVFREFAPVEGRVLRLAFAPGHYQLRVTFLNRIITAPAVVEVTVEDGRVTPVRITLAEEGSTLVQTRETSHGGTYYGRYGRSTKLSSAKQSSYGLSATAEPREPYQLKQLMPYAQETAK